MTDPRRLLARCPRCDMRRVGSRRYCVACGQDLLPADGVRPGPGPAGRRASPPAGPPGSPVSPARLPHAHRLDQPGPSAPVAPRATRVGPGVGRAAGGSSAAGDGRFDRIARAFGSLDQKTRRTVVRLAAELILLAVVVAVISGGPIIRGALRGPTPSPSAVPHPAATAPGTGISVADVVRVFGGEHAGSFEFETVGGLSPHLQGQAADGGTVLDLYGPTEDLTTVVLTLMVVGDRVVEPEGRRLLTLFLALFAPDALTPLAKSLDDTLASGTDQPVVVGSGRVEARLEAQLQAGRGVTVTIARRGQP